MIKLSKKQLKEKRNFVVKYMGDGNCATLSEVDPNSNQSHKSIATMEGEINKDVQVQVNRYILGEKIKEVFGNKIARQYYNDLKTHTIYVNDESALRPYCLALSLVPFIHGGASKLAGDSKAPEHLASFCGSYINLMFAIAGQVAGAVADVSLLTYFHYFAKKDFGEDYLNTHTKEIENYFQQIVYSLNSPAGARNFQSIFYNTSVFDKGYFEALFGEAIYPDGTKADWEGVNRLQKFFLNWFGEERHKALLTFPVITAAYLTKDNDVVDKDFNDFLATQMEKGNSFFHYHSSTVDSLSSCCRLRNQIEVDPFAYSLGGTGIMTGSLKVITLNMNYIIQKKVDLKKKVQDVHKYLVAFRMLMQDMEKSRLFPAYDEGYIAIDKQYITVGINGMVEAAEYLGYEITNNEPYKDWIKNTFKVISDENKVGAVQYSKFLGRPVMINSEIIPAEGVGVKFAKWGKKAGLKANRDCYNSYLYRTEDTTMDIFDKFALHGGDILDYLAGGSAVHLGLAEIPNKETWKKIILQAIRYGSSYWVANVKSTYCEDCGYIDMHTRNSCSKCNSTNISYCTRVVGYLKKIASFSAARQKEAGLRFYHKI